MKKLFKGMVAVVLLFSMSTSVFAATDLRTTEEGTEATEVTNTFTEPATESDITNKTECNVMVKVDNPITVTPKQVYSVNINWESLVFEYEFPSAGTGGELVWNPEKHEYSYNGNVITGGWKERTTADIKVENHSNAQVYVSTKFKEGGTTIVTDGVTASITSATSNNAGSSTTLDTVETTTGVPVSITPDTTADSETSTTITTTDVTGKSVTTYILKTAVGTKREAAPTVTNTVTVSGVPETTNLDRDNKFTVGTVVITLTKDSPTETTKVVENTDGT